MQVEEGVKMESERKRQQSNKCVPSAKESIEGSRDPTPSAVMHMSLASSIL